MNELADAEVHGSSSTSENSPATPARRRPRWPWLTVGAAILAVAGLVLAYSWWWTKPTTFTPVGNGFGFKQTSQTLHPVTVDMVQRSAHAEPETITLNSVSARVVTNTADAVISFTVCERDGIPFMSANGDAEKSCSSVSDVEGQTLQLTPDGSTTIAMTVTPQHAGRVVIHGMDVDYARDADHHWQRGTQATGPVVKLRVSE